MEEKTENSKYSIAYEFEFGGYGKKDIAYALQASCPGSNPGVRNSLFHELSAGVAKLGQRRRT